MPAQRPTHRLVVKKKNTKFWSQIGVGWAGEYGINIKLNPYVTLTDRDDFYISVKPIKRSEESLSSHDPSGDPPPPGDDDAPF